MLITTLGGSNILLKWGSSKPCAAKLRCEGSKTGVSAFDKLIDTQVQLRVQSERVRYGPKDGWINIHAYI